MVTVEIAQLDGILRIALLKTSTIKSPQLCRLSIADKRPFLSLKLRGDKKSSLVSAVVCESN